MKLCSGPTARKRANHVNGSFAGASDVAAKANESDSAESAAPMSQGERIVGNATLARECRWRKTHAKRDEGTKCYVCLTARAPE
jgi:hypothetical protein